MTTQSKKMAVFTILREQDRDINLAELLALLNHSVSERTIRRWLAEMVSDGLVKKTGQKRGTRYTINQQDSSHDIHFSEQCNLAINYVQQPLFERNPVTYNEKWFNDYIPNQTSYLSETLKSQLVEASQPHNTSLPAGTYAKHIYNRLLIDLSYNSSRLEGNTYSLLDTQRLILEGTSAKNKLDEEKIMILNHKEAISYLVNNAHKIQIDFNTLCTIHYLLADGLIPNQYAGKMRDHGVRISGSTYIPWENPEKLKNQLHAICQKASLIKNPFEQSLFLLTHIAYLQAFYDINKRTSRLSANISLIKNNLVPLSFNDVNKDDYTSAMLAIYELNAIHPLIEVYTHSYLRTCKLYKITLDLTGFDRIRVYYRQHRREMISHIIKQKLINQNLVVYIQSETEKRISKEDQAEFIHDIQEDLREINSERIAGLGITAEEMQAWIKKSKG